MAVGAVAPGGLASFYTASLEVAAELRLVEGSEPAAHKCSMLRRVLPGAPPPGLPALLATGNEIDQVRACAQLVEPEALNPPLDGAAEHPPIPLQ